MKSLKYEIIKSNKFKQVLFDVKLIVPLSNKTNTKIACFSNLIADRCTKFDTKKKMNAVLDNLYGASLSSKTSGYGQTIALSLRLVSLNEKYASLGQFKRSVSLLYELLVNTLINEETVREAKNILKDSLLRESDNPRIACLKEALKRAGKDQCLSINASGNLNEIDDITVNDIFDIQKYLLDEANVVITCVGDINRSKAKKLISRYFGEEKEGELYPTYYHFTNNVNNDELIRKTEQSQIALVYNTKVNVKDDEFWALKLGCVILGQLPVSLLFTEVREKRSLCYSISSNIYGYDGALIISTGVASDKIDETLDVTHKQVERLLKGDFEDYLIDTAKIMMINSYRSTLDDPTTILNRVFSNYILGINEDEKSFTKQIKSITKDDILKAYANLSKCSTFILKGEKN